MCDQQRLRSACTYAHQSLCLSLEYFMIVNLLTKHHKEILNLKGGCSDSHESTHVKIQYCWKSHGTAQLSTVLDLISTLCKYFFSKLDPRNKTGIIQDIFIQRCLNINSKVTVLSQCMRFPTIWYVQPAKPQISLRIRAV